MDLRNDFVDNPEGLVTLGLIYAAKEKNANLASSHSQGISTLAVSGDFDCFLAAVGTFIGIADARKIWLSIVAGASEETAIAALRLIGRRAATVLAVGIMVYEAGDCLGFW